MLDAECDTTVTGAPAAIPPALRPSDLGEPEALAGAGDSTCDLSKPVTSRLSCSVSAPLAGRTTEVGVLS